MANTTFSGPVRSEGGFEVITKAAATGAVTTNLDIDASGNVTATGNITTTGDLTTTGVILSKTALRGLGGLTQVAKAASGTVTYDVNKFNVNPYTGANQQVVTLPASAVGAVVVHVQSKDTAGGTAILRFDCAGSDKIGIGSVIETTSSSALLFDVSVTADTKITFTPADAATNCMSTGSRIYFVCLEAGRWTVISDLKDIGTGVTGTFAFS